MFRHRGKRRKHKHNIYLASLLSFVAGLVNVSGVIALGTLTTNVTGHFAYGVEAFTNATYLKAFSYFLYIQFFLLGAFSSNFIVELALLKKLKNPSVYPIFLEISILVLLAIIWPIQPISILIKHIMACALLFAMGSQNALVTKISDSLVRTTHLTGLFTDLGIELSQLFFFRQPEQKAKLKQSIHLRSMIITFFFLGCLVGGVVFPFINSNTLLLAAGCLLIAASFDTIRYRYLLFKRVT